MARILLAEDDVAMRSFITTALSRAGHDVHACPDGLSALETLQEDCRYDLLVTDIVMPGMDGIELSQKAVEPCPGLNVMFITGFSAVAMGNPAIEQDNDRVLAKPFHLKDLVARIDKILAA